MGGFGIRELALVFEFEREDATDFDLVDYHEAVRDMEMHDPAHPGEIVREEC